MNDKRVSVMRIAAISAAGHAALGIACVWTVLFVLLIAHTVPQNTVSDTLAANADELMFLMLLVFPVAFTIGGFVFGAAACHFRNFYVEHCVTPNFAPKAKVLQEETPETAIRAAA